MAEDGEYRVICGRLHVVQRYYDGISKYMAYDSAEKRAQELAEEYNEVVTIMHNGTSIEWVAPREG